MNLSPQGAQFVRLHEGFVGKWYADPVGIGTIGTGFTWGSAAFREWWSVNKPGKKFGPGATITRQEAEAALIYLFDHEYGKAVNVFLNKAVPQHVFDGTCSPVYNLGPGSLKWTWAAAVKAGDYKLAATRLRVTGVTAKGKKLPGLVRRRKEEALLIEKGVYTGVGSAPEDAMSDGMLVRGERGAAITALLTDLAALGFYDGALDDVFGYGAEAAVMAFQKSAGLKEDGYAGPKTLAAIKAARTLPLDPGTVVVVVPSEPKPAETKNGFVAWLIDIITAIFWPNRK